MKDDDALVVGGSSGLGLELAHVLSQDYRVVATGRQDPRQENIRFVRLEIGSDTDDLTKKLDTLMTTVPHVDLLVYAAGFYQEGTIDKLSDADILKMNNVGFVAPALLLRRILAAQQSLPGLIAITSTSQWTPRLYEPVYTGVKAGLGKLSDSLALDARIGKTLVAAPAGMATRFWEGTARDMNVMLDPRWVAEQILALYKDNFKYEFARIMRGPPRVEIVEKR